jgi:hypothetical protein
MKASLTLRSFAKIKELTLISSDKDSKFATILPRTPSQCPNKDRAKQRFSQKRSGKSVSF